MAEPDDTDAYNAAIAARAWAERHIDLRTIPHGHADPCPYPYCESNGNPDPIYAASDPHADDDPNVEPGY